MRIQNINQNNYNSSYPNRNVGFKQNGHCIIRFACDEICSQAARAAIDDAAIFMQKEHKVPIDIAVISPPVRGKIEVRFIDPKAPNSTPIVQEFSGVPSCQAIEEEQLIKYNRMLQLFSYLFRR